MGIVFAQLPAYWILVFIKIILISELQCNHEKEKVQKIG